MNDMNTWDMTRDEQKHGPWWKDDLPMNEWKLTSHKGDEGSGNTAGSKTKHRTWYCQKKTGNMQTKKHRPETQTREETDMEAETGDEEKIT